MDHKHAVFVIAMISVHGMIKMMNGPDDFIGPVNLGNPHEFTILQLAEAIIKLTDSKSKIIKKPLPKDDPVRRRPDITQS